LCVGTAIELCPGKPGFSEAELDKLIAEAQSVMRARTNPVDLVRIVPDS